MPEYIPGVAGNLPVQIGNVSPRHATMTTREIAELCDKRHADVMRDCRTMFDALEIGESNFASTYIDSQNKERAEYRLPRDLTLTLVTGYSIPLRNRMDELERGAAALPTASARLREARLVFNEAARIAKLAGLKDNAVILSAALATKRIIGTDPLEIVGRVHLPAPTDVEMLNPTAIGQQLDGRSGQAINRDLVEHGFQTAHRDDKQALYYEPTDKGIAAGGRMMDTGKKQGGRTIQQLLWPSSIVVTLRRLIFGAAA